MDFWQTVRVVFRRWYIAIPVLLITMGIAALVYVSIPPQYASTSVLVLTTPTTGPTEQLDADQPIGVTNPLLNFSQGLSLTAAILIQTLNDPATAAELGVAPNGGTTYAVTNGNTNPEVLITGPFVFIQGTSRTQADAQDIVRKVSERAKIDLAQRQEALDAPASTHITVSQVVAPSVPMELKGNRLRAAAAAIALGSLASLAAAFAFESLINERRNRKPGRAVPIPQAQVVDHSAPALTLTAKRRR